MNIEVIDMSPWAGREDPEPDSLRWHQCIRPLADDSPTGVALIGFASDAGVARNQGRIGAAAAPRALRKTLANLAWHRQAPAYDAGDVHCHGNALESAQEHLGKRLERLLDAGHQPIVLGGGHEVAYGSWLGLARHLEKQQREPDGLAPRIGIVNFDAHFDLRDPRRGSSSGTPFAQIAQQCDERGWPFHYACLGVSRASNTRALFERAAELDVLVREDHEINRTTLDAIVLDLERFIVHCDHLYLTIDLDVLPACEAPGVSAPAAHGVSLTLIEPLIKVIRDSGKLRVADIAELNPNFDIDGRTAKAAARLIHHLTLNA
ncbi:formimidoylglutamase [Litchfieldella qijiaojingensis]|uniref:Formimidoylglutamase n=1 Tax=Litchfieldella qijiaojingensis TaxID=980347 RepID=A0ABQ2YU00_9GAMM|nr:formimidoylglutamase [Halomonas qijiaojingensis]GGX93342.1 formimidoylglutamase [Halomonas qijiaojingensis]